MPPDYKPFPLDKRVFGKDIVYRPWHPLMGVVAVLAGSKMAVNRRAVSSECIVIYTDGGDTESVLPWPHSTNALDWGQGCCWTDRLREKFREKWKREKERKREDRERGGLIEVMTSLPWVYRSIKRFVTQWGRHRKAFVRVLACTTGRNADSNNSIKRRAWCSWGLYALRLSILGINSTYVP